MNRSALISFSIGYKARLFGLLLIGVFHLSGSARGQAEPKAAARVHFERGVTAFNERRYGEAADEFETAYRLSPAYIVLYNIGQVNVALGNSVEAVEAFETYLDQGASSVPAARRREVQAEIDEQLTRIGELTIITRPEQAELRIDGKLVGKTPLTTPIRVTAGKHTVQVVLTGYEPDIRELEVGGKSSQTLELALESSTANDAESDGEAGNSLAEPTTTRSNSDVGNSLTPTKDPAVPADASMSWLRVTGCVVAVGGVALGTLGAVQVLRGVALAKDASAKLTMAATREEYAAHLPNYNAGKSRSETGWVLLGVGAGVIAGGLIVALVAPDGAQQSAWQLAPWFGSRQSGFELGAQAQSGIGAAGLQVNGVW